MAKVEIACRDCGKTRIDVPSRAERRCKSCSVRIKKTIHGLRHTRIYKIWAGMIDRCYRENSTFYRRYGGRGITVCEAWRNSAKVFADWALANGYADDLTIERKDNDLSYSPGNCRWATKAEQTRNTGATKFIEIDGRVECATLLFREFGVTSATFYRRIRNGWSAVEALKTPSRPIRRRALHGISVQVV